MVLATTKGRFEGYNVVVEQPLQTVTRHCNLEKGSGCLKSLTRSYWLLLALEMKGTEQFYAVISTYSSWLVTKPWRRMPASARCAETQMLWNSVLWHQVFQCSPHVQKSQPQAGCTEILCWELSILWDSWVLQLGFTNAYSIRRKEGHKGILITVPSLWQLNTDLRLSSGNFLVGVGV